ncbi:MAG: sugar ABC transporter ATP-binding protein [Paracoccaceae bacterium]
MSGEKRDSHPIGLTIRGATKVYPGTRALDDVDFDIRMGAVNVLVGENGAGKSTLMKVIAGVETLTDGVIAVDGKPVTIRTKDDAVKAGIGIVFQELNLFPDLTVAENVFMGREPTRWGVDIDRGQVAERTRALLARLEQDIDPATPLGFLRIGQQQVIEIAKALAEDAKILILDEPTSALSAQEVEVLFRIIDDLKAQGVGIVYISHRLEELIRVGDYITVLRDGKVTGSRSMEGVDIPWIVQAMIGGKSKDFSESLGHAFGEEVFRAEDITLPKMGGGYTVDHVSFAVRKGEILGLYGLMGAGRSEFLECVMAQHPAATGRFFIEGREMREKQVAGRIDRGIALVPEDRKRDGLIQIMAIRENLTLSLAQILHQAVRPQPAPGSGAGGGVHQAAHDQGGEPRKPGVVALGRQPAEGGDRQGADDRAQGAAARRTLARDRHRRQGRDLPHHARAGLRGDRDHLRDLRSRGGAGAFRPDRRDGRRKGDR